MARVPLRWSSRVSTYRPRPGVSEIVAVRGVAWPTWPVKFRPGVWRWTRCNGDQVESASFTPYGEVDPHAPCGFVCSADTGDFTCPVHTGPHDRP